MNHTLKTISDVEKEITVTFPAAEVSERFAETFRRVARTASIKGFRPGKVPLSVVKQMYGKAVAEEVEAHFLETGIRETVVKENLRLIEHPAVTQRNPLIEGADFTFSFKVELFPTIAAEVRECHVAYTPVEFKEEMLEEEVTSFRRRHTVFSKVERPARDGDRVTVTFAGTHEGKELPGVKGTEVPVMLGEKHFLEGFEDALRGRRAGEKTGAAVPFPENYHAKEIAGKTVDFSIELVAVEEAQVPELTDEFVAQHHDKAKTVAELRDVLREGIVRYLDDINRETQRHLVVERYVREADFPVPPSFLGSETASRREEHKRRARVEELTPDDEKTVREEAQFAAKRFLLLQQLARDLSVTVDDKALEEGLAAEAARYGVPIEHYKRYVGEHRVEERRLVMQERLVIDRLIEKAVFEKKPRAEKPEKK